jgi:hypothetical protein
MTFCEQLLVSDVFVTVSSDLCVRDGNWFTDFEKDPTVWAGWI